MEKAEELHSKFSRVYSSWGQAFGWYEGKSKSNALFLSTGIITEFFSWPSYLSAVMFVKYLEAKKN